MSPHAQTDAPSLSDQDDPHLLAHLHALLDVGATIAQAIKRQAEAEPTPEAAPANPIKDLAEQFERVSRAMRRTILLIRHIARPAQNPVQQRTLARKRIIREIEDAIQRETDDPGPLHAEFRERLDAPDLEEEIANRPVADIITDIRRDLGLDVIYGAHPWDRRTPRDLATLHARAAAPTPPGPYQPAPHGPDLQNPRRRPRPPDNGQELIALAKLLSG